MKPAIFLAAALVLLGCAGQQRNPVPHTRPRFKLVTGISTGVLIAPMAFLGEEYDAALEDFYTGVSSRDIYRMRPAGDSFASSAHSTD